MNLSRLRPSPAMLVALLALVMACAGTSYAAITITGKNVQNNSLTGKDIKNGSATGKDIKNGSVAGADVKNRSLTEADVKAGSLSGASVKGDSLGGAQVDESGLDASKLGAVAKATDADTLDGVDSSALARGAIATTTGSATMALGEDRQLPVAIGRFELNCTGGVSGADVRYRNTTGADARVWRSYVLDDGTADTLMDVAGPGADHGLAFAEANRSTIRATQGSASAELRAFSMQQGANCHYSWELVQGQS